MKHLKKFNESIKRTEDYIKTCFVEFFDDDIVDIDSYGDRVVLNIVLPGVGRYDDGKCIKDDISNYIKYLDELKELILNIEVCVKNVIDEYPEMSCSIEQDEFKVITVVFEKNKKNETYKKF